MSHPTNRRTMSRLAGVVAAAATTAVLGAGTAAAQQSCYPPTPNCSTFTVGRPGATITITGTNWNNANATITKGTSNSASTSGDTGQVAYSFAGQVMPDGTLRLRLPDDLEPGDYVLSISGTDHQGLARTEERPLEVRDASSTDAGAADPSTTDGAGTDREVVASAPTSSPDDGNGGALLALLGVGVGGAAIAGIRKHRASTD